MTLFTDSGEEKQKGGRGRKGLSKKRVLSKKRNNNNRGKGDRFWFEKTDQASSGKMEGRKVEDKWRRRPASPFVRKGGAADETTPRVFSKKIGAGS